MLGGKGRYPEARIITTATIRISRSRLNTRMVSHQANCFLKARTINDEESKSLSAMGSRYAPSEERWLNLRAISPSMPSENPAITKNAVILRASDEDARRISANLRLQASGWLRSFASLRMTRRRYFGAR